MLFSETPFPIHFPFPLPEGFCRPEPGPSDFPASITAVERAITEKRIFEAVPIRSDGAFRLFFDLGAHLRGVMEKSECVAVRPGEAVKDIAVLTRVGKPTAFSVIGYEEEENGLCLFLSRRSVQEDCIRNMQSLLRPGDLIPARVTHLEPFGAFCDIGAGVISLLSIDCISISRISHPRDRLSVGDRIMTAVKSIDRETGRIYLTLKELLGTWEENASRFSPGETVAGTVRSIEHYGIFVELAPNLAGLAEITEERGESHRDLPAVGDTVAVYIKSILKERMKIKLVLIDSGSAGGNPLPKKPPLPYCIDFQTASHLSRFRYSPPACPRVIETVFDTEE